MADPIATPTPEVVTLSDLATMPLRIEISKRAQWQEGDDNLRMVPAASIYRLPRGKEKPVLLLGPVGVPGNPDASWPELLRCIADAIELEAEITAENATAQHDCGHTCCDERNDPTHDHFLAADNCPSCVNGTA